MISSKLFARVRFVSIEKIVQTFDDVINNNKSFVSTFEHEELTGTAKEGLAIVIYYIIKCLYGFFY